MTLVWPRALRSGVGILALALAPGCSDPTSAAAPAGDAESSLDAAPAADVAPEAATTEDAADEAVPGDDVPPGLDAPDVVPASDAAPPPPTDAPPPDVADVPGVRDVAVSVDVPPPDAGVRCASMVEVVIYDEGTWNLLAEAFRAAPAPCADYHLSIPATGDGTMPRGGEAATMRARGPRFHALAEFHWGSWSAVTGMTWYQKGVEFRRRMVAAGYDVTAGDSWAVNELPSTTRGTDPATRDNIREAVRGLHDGPPGAPPARGAVFGEDVGSGQMNFGPFKAALEAQLTDAAFWQAMAADVRWYGLEVYDDPADECVGGTTVAARSDHIDAYTMHMPALAALGPAAAHAARDYLAGGYVPMLNAAWQSPAYGRVNIPVADMEHHVSTEVYATRAWAGAHAYPGERIGFAWPRQQGAATVPELQTLAGRLAVAIRDAYDPGAPAARACSPSGAYTWCQCDLAGAHFNEGWRTSFASW